MRTVVAYANGNGGRLVFGVEDNTWQIIGFTKEEVFQKIDAVTNAIYDSCEPKITPGIVIQEGDHRWCLSACVWHDKEGGNISDSGDGFVSKKPEL